MRQLLCIVALCLCCIPSFATHTCKICYIDFANGSDANDGASKTNTGGTTGPWKHSSIMSGATGNAASQLPAPDDQYIFKGGVIVQFSPTNTWPWGSARNGAGPSGKLGHPIVFGYDPTWNTGQVLSVRPTSSGYNCSAIQVTLTGGGGTGATATAQFQTSGYLAGLLQHVTVTNPGSGYTSNPTVSFIGSTCTALPTAVADIYSPIFDTSGTIWTQSNGAEAYYGPIETRAHYLKFDHIEVRGQRTSSTEGSGAMWTHIGDGGLFQHMYFHNVGPATVQTVIAGTVALSVNGGYGFYSTDVDSSFFDNYENEITGANCGFNNGTPNYFEPPCGSSVAVTGATKLTNNIVHDWRGQVYSPSKQGLDYHGNTIWNTVYDCCQQHEDTFYFFGGGVIYNNTIHDAAPLGAANMYIELSDSVGNCNQTYLYNNVVWNVGRSTQPIGFTGEFYSQACNGNNSITVPKMYAYNNTLYAKNGANSCIGANQWYGIKTANFYIYDNHCLSNQAELHWYDSNGGNYGTWNGLSNPNSTATQAAIDAVNTVQDPVTAASQGYTPGNGFAPSAANNATVLASASIFAPCLVSLSALCSDIHNVSRTGAGSNPWQHGAYKYGPSAPTGLMVTVQ